METSGPPRNDRAVISVYAFGYYRHRQPLAYAPIRTAAASRVALTDRLETADLVVVAHTKDLDAHGAELRRRMGPAQRLVLLSEEPFWDTIWGRDPFTRAQTHHTDDGPLPVTVLNHATSRIYDFERIPYFLLTDHRYCIRYAMRFARNAKRDAGTWSMHFARLRDIHFMAERRGNAKYDTAFAHRDVFGLAALRTRIAEACDGSHVIRQGKGWTGHRTRRQELEDWHFNKLRGFDERCLILSAIENTHQANYITEKLFDAFAVGAVPLYWASSGHRVHEVAPDGGWLNLYGLDAAAAAGRIMSLSPDETFLEGYAATQRRLAALFCDVTAPARERKRLTDSLVAEFREVINSRQGPDLGAV